MFKLILITYVFLCFTGKPQEKYTSSNGMQLYEENIRSDVVANDLTIKIRELKRQYTFTDCANNIAV